MGIFKSILLSLFSSLLINESIHNSLRDLAKKTNNKFDDAAIEKIIAYFKDISSLIKGG